MVIYFFGGWNSPKVVVGPTQGPGLYLIGLVIVALYAPLYWWRAWQDRKLSAAEGVARRWRLAATAPGPRMSRSSGTRCPQANLRASRRS